MPFSRHWIMHIEAMQRIKNGYVRSRGRVLIRLLSADYPVTTVFLESGAGVA